MVTLQLVDELGNWLNLNFYGKLNSKFEIKIKYATKPKNFEKKIFKQIITSTNS